MVKLSRVLRKYIPGKPETADRPGRLPGKTWLPRSWVLCWSKPFWRWVSTPGQLQGAWGSMPCHKPDRRCSHHLRGETTDRQGYARKYSRGHSSQQLRRRALYLKQHYADEKHRKPLFLKRIFTYTQNATMAFNLQSAFIKQMKNHLDIPKIAWLSCFLMAFTWLKRFCSHTVLHFYDFLLDNHEIPIANSTKYSLPLCLTTSVNLHLNQRRVQIQKPSTFDSR